jgi:hypothetical protein
VAQTSVCVGELAIGEVNRDASKYTNQTAETQRRA